MSSVLHLSDATVERMPNGRLRVIAKRRYNDADSSRGASPFVRESSIEIDLTDVLRLRKWLNEEDKK